MKYILRKKEPIKNSNLFYWWSETKWAAASKFGDNKRHVPEPSTLKQGVLDWWDCYVYACVCMPGVREIWSKVRGVTNQIHRKYCSKIWCSRVHSHLLHWKLSFSEDSIQLVPEATHDGWCLQLCRAENNKHKQSLVSRLKTHFTSALVVSKERSVKTGYQKQSHSARVGALKP